MNAQPTPTMPAGMVVVTQDEFFALLKADQRDIMPRNDAPDFTTWRIVRSGERWGWSTPGWKYPGAAKVYAVVRVVKKPGAES